MNSTMPKQGKALPKIVKYTEAALVVAFFIIVKSLMLIYWLHIKRKRVVYVLRRKNKGV